MAGDFVLNRNSGKSPVPVAAPISGATSAPANSFTTPAEAQSKAGSGEVVTQYLQQTGVTKSRDQAYLDRPTYETRYAVTPPPPGDGWRWNGQSWSPPRSGSLSDLSGFGITARITGSDRAAKFLDPVGDVAVNDVAEGKNVFESLQRTMGANQRDITDTFGEVGTLLGEGGNPDGFFGGLKGWGENLSFAEKRNLGAQSTAHQQVKSGNVSEGWKTGYEGQRDFFNDRNVQAAIAVAATMGAASAMAPYLASTLGISNGAAMALANGITSGAVRTMQTGDIGKGLRTGVASGLGGYAASYVPNLGNAALTGAARGAVSSGVSQLAQTGKIDEQRLASAAVGGGISSGLAPYGRGVSGLVSGAAVGAINGGSEGAQSGAIRGLLTGYGQEYGGNTGSAVGGLLAGRINQQNRPQVNQRPRQIMRPQVVQQQAGQGYNPQQMQQLYAQYLAQKRG